MKVYIDAAAEREYEKKHIARQHEKYLATDVLERYQNDAGYREKMKLYESFLHQFAESGLTLDLGANTAGEAEILVHKGFSVVATDINEIALSLSQRRAKKYERTPPIYIAADAHHLPFMNETFDCIIAFEVLHHFEDVDSVLAELHRVLKPGGFLMTYEPYALNPYRKLAELRFKILGSIEKSFTVRAIETKLSNHGLTVIVSDRHVLPPSAWKKKYVSRLRAVLKEIYYSVSSFILPVFGNIHIIAQKPGKRTKSESKNVLDRLMCPVTKSRLVEYAEYFESSSESPKFRYKKFEDIPVLIKEDSIRVR